MTNEMGLEKLRAPIADEDQNAQNLLSRVSHRGQRVGREHRQTREPRQSFVVCEVRRNRVTDNQPLDLRENAFF